MKARADVRQFNRRFLTILANARPSTYDECVGLIKDLRSDYRNVTDLVARQEIERALTELMLRIVILGKRPLTVVRRRFRDSLKQGFCSESSECHLSIEYAEYCGKQQRKTEGLQTLESARERLLSRDALPSATKQHMRRELENSMKRLMKKSG
jgi:hypothetical protein